MKTIKKKVSKRPNRKFRVEGCITIWVKKLVSAPSEGEAIRKARELAVGKHRAQSKHWDPMQTVVFELD